MRQPRTIKKFILCEGKCSLPIPYEFAEAREKENFDYEHDLGERAKSARQILTGKLRMRPHTFQRVEQSGGRVDFMFVCDDCGSVRSYGVVPALDRELRKEYFV